MIAMVNGVISRVTHCEKGQHRGLRPCPRLVCGPKLAGSRIECSTLGRSHYVTKTLVRASPKTGSPGRRNHHKADIQLRSPDSWDSLMRAYPAILVVDGKLTMFYDCNDFGAEGFGCAVLDP